MFFSFYFRLAFFLRLHRLPATLSVVLLDSFPMGALTLTSNSTYSRQYQVETQRPSESLYLQLPLLFLLHTVLIPQFMTNKNKN